MTPTETANKLSQWIGTAVKIGSVHPRFAGAVVLITLSTANLNSMCSTVHMKSAGEYLEHEAHEKLLTFGCLLNSRYLRNLLRLGDLV